MTTPVENTTEQEVTTPAVTAEAPVEAAAAVESAVTDTSTSNEEQPATEAPSAVEEPAVETPPTPTTVEIPTEPLSEVKETIVEKAEDLVNEVVNVLKKEDSAEISSFKTLISSLGVSGSNSQKEVIRVFEDYVSHMGVGMLMTRDRGVKYQVNLWKSILIVLSRIPREEFKDTWNLILNYFNEYRNTTFSEAYVFRFADQWHISTVELKMFQSILNLIHLTCNPATRSAGLKQVDLERTLSTGFIDEARQRIMNFYGQ